MNRCLYCYEVLSPHETDFHPNCSIHIFDSNTPPALSFSEQNLEESGKTMIRSQRSLTGVQPKLYFESKPMFKQDHAATAALNACQQYIVKPCSPRYPHIAEVEHLTMRLAALSGIRTVPHSLIRLHSGGLAYITSRIDRQEKSCHLEDMCQLSGLPPKEKYNGSYEGIADILKQYSSQPSRDLVAFYRQVLFAFVTGNADMHLKNFSMQHYPRKAYRLAPAYDHVAMVLVNPEDDEDMALTLNGKTKNIGKEDFEAAFSKAGLAETQQARLFSKLRSAGKLWAAVIRNSFLPEPMKQEFHRIIQLKYVRLGWA